MKMEFRIFEDEDYPIVTAWWKAHGFPPVPFAILPKLGAIVSNEKQDICAGWLYMDNSVGVCWLEWSVTNPECSGFDSIRGIKALNKFIEERASEMGYGVMMTTCRQESLCRLHEKCGFIKTDTGMIHMVKQLPLGGNK